MFESSGEYYNFIDNNCDTTVVVFSSINVPRGKFSCSRAFDNKVYNYLFINCPNNSWYLNNIFPNCYSFKENCEYLKRFLVNKLGEEHKIITYGGSMGGYGALVFGLAIKADYVIATGVEHKLMIGGGNSTRFLKAKINGLIPNVHDLLKDFNGRAFIIYGENYMPDILCAFDLKDTQIELVTLKNKPHSIPPYIESKFGLTNFISKTLDSDCLPFDSDEIGDILNSDSVPLLYEAFLEIKRKCFSQQKLDELIECSNSCDSVSATAYCLLYIGIYFYENGKVEDAMRFLFKSRDLGLNNSEILSYIAYCYYDIGSYYKSSQFSKRAAYLSPLYSEKILMVHSRNLIKMGNVDDAVSFLNEFCPNSSGMVNYQLARCYYLLNDIDNALIYIKIAQDILPDREDITDFVSKLEDLVS